MSTNNNYDMIFKLILIGDSSVGKTNILSKYLRDEFDPQSKATVGVEFGNKNVELDGKNIRFQIWDTAGEERYRSITSAYYKGAKGAILVYDISRKLTFDNVDKWLPDLKSNGDSDMFIMLIGNKSDLVDERKVTAEEGKKKAEEYKLVFMETSAFNGDNIENAFKELEENVYRLSLSSSNKEDKNIQIKTNLDGNDIINEDGSVKKNEKKRKCC